MRSCLHTPCVKPAPPDTFELCWFASLLLRDICWCCRPGAEWAGRGWLSPPGCPAAQDSCLGSQCQLPRTHRLTAQEHLLQGTRGLEGGQIPVLHSSLYFLVTVHISDSDCFISATWIFLKIHLRVTLHKLMMSGGGAEARLCWCTVGLRILWSHTWEKKRSDLELHSLPSSSRTLWVMGLRGLDYGES